LTKIEIIEIGEIKLVNNIMNGYKNRFETLNYFFKGLISISASEYIIISEIFYKNIKDGKEFLKWMINLALILGNSTLYIKNGDQIFLERISIQNSSLFSKKISFDNNRIVVLKKMSFF
jgi:hypothetical protein